MACHGNNLEGGVGAKLQKVGSKLSVDQIKNQIIMVAVVCLLESSKRMMLKKLPFG
ncbi:hypothetical protein [Paenibacillus aestuarii]|uniref:Uncharacterized protein n=1 Tax=Paenibacillus aestuarii TaxID=516965 RepID=A0ABW0JZU1_9BACL